MQAFVASVLLGVSGLDAFDMDTEAQPPDGESAESEQGMGEAKGVPLSVRIAPGSPKVLKVCSNTEKTTASLVDSRPSQASR